jgi:hypothetical protein
MVTQLALPMWDAQDWLTSLSQRKQVFVDSSTPLVREILRRQEARQQQGHGVPAKHPARVPQLPPQIEVIPLALLHAIGRITTPIVPKLADLSATWALYRCIWAFDPRASHLCLSEYARDIDFHQKGLLSDEIGVGMACWLMLERFGARAVIDVDIALRRPQVAAQMGIPPVLQTSRPMPDYIFSLPDGEYAVVECKGSQSGQGTSMDQIRRGLEQVPSITFADGQAAREFVVATLLSRTRTTVYVLDPPVDSPDRPGYETGESESGFGKRGFFVQDRQPFDRSVRRIHAAGLLAFAGAWSRAVETARVALPEGTRPRDERLVEVRVEEVDADFRGYSFAVPFRGPAGLELSVFQGLAADVYNLVSTGRFLEADAQFWPEPECWVRLRQRVDSGGNRIITLLGEGGDRVYTLGIDGSFVRLSFA